jgi:hypothetical protein
MNDVEPTDLVCRAWRHLLSSDERRRIDALLERSHEARLANVLLRGFETESSVQRGDDALASRIVGRAIGTLRRPRARRDRLLVLAAAATVLLVAGAAAAWRITHRSTSSMSPPLGASPTCMPSRGIQSAALQPVGQEAVIASPITDGQVRLVASAGVGSRVENERAVTPRRGTETARASELFARANLLRRQGHSSEAAGTYRRLIETYPTTRETPPSRLALAKLLANSQPAQALEQYRHLATVAGPLQAEALWGVAESARRLGQRAIERQAASELLRLFPDSPYADVARGRLGNETR